MDAVCISFYGNTTTSVKKHDYFHIYWKNLENMCIGVMKSSPIVAPNYVIDR